MKKTWRIENLDCPNCAAKLELALAALPGVEAASVNFVNKTVAITAGKKEFAAVEQAVQAETARVEPEAKLVEEVQEHHHHGHHEAQQGKPGRKSQSLRPLGGVGHDVGLDDDAGDDEAQQDGAQILRTLLR